MNLLNYLKKSLGKNCCSQGDLINQIPLQRSDDYCIQYGKWLKLNKHQPMLQSLYEASLNNKSCCNKKDAFISFLMISKINGFTIKYDDKRWVEEDFKYLFEYMATYLIEDHEFATVSPTEEVTEFLNKVERVERYKLKDPALGVDYSEILLRLCYTNNQITSIKFCGTCTKKRITNLSGLIKKMADA
ncbi:MAG: hypothetical protein JKY03_10530 [Aureispira sp.]|nr:hypothetical protein [Aureispira sp.]